MVDEYNTYDGKPSLITSVSNWVRFSDYEIIENGEGIHYIVPAKNAIMELYNPFEYTPEIIKDFLNIIWVVPAKYRLSDNYLNFSKWDKPVKQSVFGEIIRFAKKYGLSGLFWKYADIVLNENGGMYYEDARLKQDNIFYKDWLLGDDRFRETIEYLDYAKYFFPRDRKDIVSYFYFEVEGQLKTGYFNDKFLENYSEPILLFLNELQQFYILVRFWEELNNNGHLPNDVFDNENLPKVTWGDILYQFGAGPYDIRLYHKDKYRIAWSYRYLIDAIKLLFMFDVTSSSQKVRTCKNEKCRRVYIAIKDSSKYCCPECGNAQRVRQKHIKDNLLKKENAQK